MLAIFYLLLAFMVSMTPGSGVPVIFCLAFAFGLMTMYHYKDP